MPNVFEHLMCKNCILYEKLHAVRKQSNESVLYMEDACLTSFTTVSFSRITVLA
jgi:hypothetical protein